MASIEIDSKMIIGYDVQAFMIRHKLAFNRLIDCGSSL